MIELVTLEQAKDHLRIDDDYGDSDLSLKIQGGSAAIISYIQGSRNLVVDSAGKLIEGETLARVQTYCLAIWTGTGVVKRKRN